MPHLNVNECYKMYLLSGDGASRVVIRIAGRRRSAAMALALGLF